MIQVCEEGVLSESRMKRKRLSDQKKKRSKKRKVSPEKRARKLERTPK